MAELYDQGPNRANQDPYQGLEQNPELVASEQVRLADEWARVYADPDHEPTTSAEIIFRNPSVYLNDVNRSQLPEDLKLGWEKAEKFAEQIVSFGDSKETEWSRYASPIEKVQSLVQSGSMNPMVRGSVADLMRVSAGLFSESTKHIPGNTPYYAGNVRGAAGWLNRH